MNKCHPYKSHVPIKLQPSVFKNPIVGNSEPLLKQFPQSNIENDLSASIGWSEQFWKTLLMLSGTATVFDTLEMEICFFVFLVCFFWWVFWM